LQLGVDGGQEPAISVNVAEVVLVDEGHSLFEEVGHTDVSVVELVVIGVDVLVGHRVGRLLDGKGVQMDVRLGAGQFDAQLENVGA
jgi:hypothetical protein